MITKNDLLEWLKEIDRKIKTKMVLVAVSGTALTLLGLKPSTLDVDFCIDGNQEALFKKSMGKPAFKVDIFRDGFIFAEQLPSDYLEKSISIKTNLARIDLRALSLVDIILTKIARYNERDEDDISAIVAKNKVNKEELERRFKLVRDSYAGNVKDYDYYFRLVLKRHFK